MRKPTLLLLIVGLLIAAGIGLSFYGSQIITEGLDSGESTLEPGKTLEIQSKLDPSVTDTGVFVVQIMNFKPSSIEATLYDPYETQIISEKIEKESFEKQFEINNLGQYKLVIQNTGNEKFQVIGVLGHLPDKTKFSVGLIGFYVLLVGLVGIVGVGAYVIKNRKKIN